MAESCIGTMNAEKPLLRSFLAGRARRQLGTKRWIVFSLSSSGEQGRGEKAASVRGLWDEPLLRTGSRHCILQRPECIAREPYLTPA